MAAAMGLQQSRTPAKVLESPQKDINFTGHSATSIKDSLARKSSLPTEEKMGLPRSVQSSPLPMAHCAAHTHGSTDVYP